MVRLNPKYPTNTQCALTDPLVSVHRYLKVRELATGKVIDDDADVVIAAKGNLSDPAWPKIPGLKEFEGEVMHSARWKEE